MGPVGSLGEIEVEFGQTEHPDITVLVAAAGARLGVVELTQIITRAGVAPAGWRQRQAAVATDEGLDLVLAVFELHRHPVVIDGRIETRITVQVHLVRAVHIAEVPGFLRNVRRAVGIVGIRQVEQRRGFGTVIVQDLVGVHHLLRGTGSGRHLSVIDRHACILPYEALPLSSVIGGLIDRLGVPASRTGIGRKKELVVRCQAGRGFVRKGRGGIEKRKAVTGAEVERLLGDFGGAFPCVFLSPGTVVGPQRAGSIERGLRLDSPNGGAAQFGEAIAQQPLPPLQGFVRGKRLVARLDDEIDALREAGPLVLRIVVVLAERLAQDGNAAPAFDKLKITVGAQGIGLGDHQILLGLLIVGFEAGVFQVFQGFVATENTVEQPRPAFRARVFVVPPQRHARSGNTPSVPVVNRRRLGDLLRFVAVSCHHVAPGGESRRRARLDGDIERRFQMFVGTRQQLVDAAHIPGTVVELAVHLLLAAGPREEQRRCGKSQ